jgi:hypothetical protein
VVRTLSNSPLCRNIATCNPLRAARPAQEERRGVDRRSECACTRRTTKNCTCLESSSFAPSDRAVRTREENRDAKHTRRVDHHSLTHPHQVNMQRPPPRSRGGASRIPRPQGSLGDLRNPSLGHGELARSHDSGISRSASLVSLASMAASRTAVTRRRAVSRPDVLDEGRGVAACFDRSSSSRGECTAEEHFLVHLECRHALEVAKVR